jgi:hypothetical protein
MKRVILFLATALLGTSTACSSRSPPGRPPAPPAPGDITLFWSFQDGVSGSLSGQPGDNNGCGVAGVDSVDVTIDGSTQTFTCTGPNAAGITFGSFAPGNYPFNAVGFRGNEQVFTGSGTAAASSGVNTETAVVHQALNPQSFEVFYSVANFSGTTPTQCVFDGQQVAGIWFRLEDQNGNVVATTEVLLPGGGVGQQPVACDPNSFGIITQPLSFGQYRLRYLQAVNGAGVAIAQVCSFAVSHSGFPPVVTLLSPTGTCP